MTTASNTENNIYAESKMTSAVFTSPNVGVAVETNKISESLYMIEAYFSEKYNKVNGKDIKLFTIREIFSGVFMDHRNDEHFINFFTTFK